MDMVERQDTDGGEAEGGGERVYAYALSFKTQETVS